MSGAEAQGWKKRLKKLVEGRILSIVFWVIAFAVLVGVVGIFLGWW